MHALGLSVGLSIVGSFVGVIVASSMLLFPDAARIRLVSWLISYAVGTLLGASLLHLLPEALATVPPSGALGALLGGILTFFALEKLVIWRHCHEEGDCVDAQQHRVAGHRRRRLSHLRRRRHHRRRSAHLGAARGQHGDRSGRA